MIKEILKNYISVIDGIDIEDCDNYQIIIYYDKDKEKYFILKSVLNSIDDNTYSWYEIDRQIWIFTGYVSDIPYYHSIKESIYSIINKGFQIWCADSFFDIVDLINKNHRKEE